MECPIPDDRRNATVYYSGTEYSDEAVYVCDVGFTYHALDDCAMSEVCQANGNWTYSDFECQGKLGWMRYGFEMRGF